MTQPRHRVCIVAPSLDILGGQAVQAARLLNKLRGSSVVEVDFLAINPRLPGPLGLLQRVKYIRTLVTSVTYVATLLVRVRRYDLLHVFSASYFSFLLAPFPALLIARLYRRPAILNYRSGEAEDHLRRSALAVWALRVLPSDIVVPSAFLVNVFSRFGLTATAIGNFVDFESPARAHRPLRPVFLSNRNLEPLYNVPCVLRAFALIQQRIPDARLIIAGDGSQRRELAALAANLSLRQVEFVGRTRPEDMRHLYSRADVYLNAPNVDNMPTSVIEAFAAGLCVVSTNAGGIPHIAIHEETALLVDRNDHAGMANAALRLFSEPALRSRLTRQARAEYLSKYLWSVVGPQWEGRYLRLIGAERHAQRGSSRGFLKRESTTRRSTLAVRARRRTLSELRCRGLQESRKILERLGFTGARGHLFRSPSVDILAPRPLPAFRNRAQTAAMLRRRRPEAESAAIARGERILCGSFDLLGFRALSFGNPLDWHLDPVRRIRAPRIHWSRLKYLDPAVVGDHKIVWELNRHQHFVDLGKAYWYTKDERFAEAFVQQVNSWLDANPPGIGVNWASSLEVAYRAIAWLWALQFFADSPQLTSSFRSRALHGLNRHGHHIARFLSTYFSPNTHLTGEALGLLYLGTLLPQLDAAPRWRALGERILREQLPIQVKPDGVYFEKASYYQRYTADIYLHAIMLLRLSEEMGTAQTDSGLLERLDALLDHLQHLARPNGTTPFVGDDDGGRVLDFEHRELNDFRATLSTGAVLFRRADFAHSAGGLSEETIWLLGPEVAEQYHQLEPSPPEKTSRAFEDGGIFVMRDGWIRDANYAVINCGPHGALSGGHAHADALSLEIACRGRAIFADPGTYVYSASPEERDYFRSTAAHSTVLVDGESSSVSSGPFAWSTKATGILHCWASSPDIDLFEGSHDGFLRLAAPATHRRSVLFVRGSYWIVRDTLCSRPDDVNGVTGHEMTVLFQCADGVVAHRAAEHACDLVAHGETLLRLAIIGKGRLQLERGWTSNAYGARTPTMVCAFRVPPDEYGDVISVLMPRAVADGAPQIREIECLAGRALSISGPDWDDLVLIGSHNDNVCGVTTDADWAWLRRPRAAWCPLKAGIVRGSRMSLDGQHVIHRPTRVMVETATVERIVPSVGSRLPPVNSVVGG